MAGSLDDLGLLTPAQRSRWTGLPLHWLSTPSGVWRHRFTPDVPALSMLERGSLTARLRVHGRTSDLDAHPGTLALFRPGIEVEAHQVDARNARRIVFELDVAAWQAKGLLDDELLAAALEYVPRFADPALAGALGGMLREMLDGSPNGPLYAESLSVGVVTHLAHTQAVRRSATQRERGRLACWQLARIDELIRGDLASELSLGVLAAAVGLSRPHFVRLFKNATGLSPHRYVQRQRVERAGELIRTTDIPLVEVASVAGFSSQSHLTRLFRETFGVTPSEARRQHRLPCTRGRSE